MSDIEFDTPATRVIKQFSEDGKEQFRIPADLPDLAFLRRLSIQGRLFYENQASINTFTLTHNVAVGSTDFIYKMILNVGSGGAWTFVLNNNNQERLTIRLVGVSFVIDILDSLVGDGVKTFTVVATETAGATTASITLLGWTENTSQIRDVTI